MTSETMEKKNKYLTKNVAYAGKKFTLYSIDGDTWSSRPDELEHIMNRHEEEKATYSGQIKGGPQARIPTVRPKATSVSAHCLRVSKERDDAVEPEAKIQPKTKAPAAAAETPELPRASSAALKSAKGKKEKPVEQKSKKAEKIKAKAALPVKAKVKASTSSTKVKKAATPKKRASGRPVKANLKAKSKANKKAAG